LDMRPRGGHRRPGHQRGHDARDLPIDRCERILRGRCPRTSLGRTSRCRQCQNRSPMRSQGDDIDLLSGCSFKLRGSRKITAGRCSASVRSALAQTRSIGIAIHYPVTNGLWIITLTSTCSDAMVPTRVCCGK
jgi:hypothetical protein